MRIFSLLALVALGAHAWVWHVDHSRLTTDAYGAGQVRDRSPFPLPGSMRHCDVRLLRLGCADSLGYLIHG